TACTLLVLGFAPGRAGGNQDEVPPAWEDGPGTQAWNNDDVKCASDADCTWTETCINRVCQMRGCSQPSYQSTAPMSIIHYFGRHREIAMVGDGEYVDTYEPKDASYTGSFDFSNQGGTIADLPGGDFLGKRPQALAFAHDSSDTVEIVAGGNPMKLKVGIWP